MQIKNNLNNRDTSIPKIINPLSDNKNLQLNQCLKIENKTQVLLLCGNNVILLTNVVNIHRYNINLFSKKIKISMTTGSKILQNLLIFQRVRSKYIHTYIIILHIIVEVMDVSTNYYQDFIVYAKKVGNIQLKKADGTKFIFLQKTYKIDHSEHANHIGLSIDTSKLFNL